MYPISWSKVSFRLFLMATEVSKTHLKTCLLVFLIFSFLSISLSFIKPQGSPLSTTSQLFNGRTNPVCDGLRRLKDYKSICSFIQSNNPCVSQGFLDYLYLFYCICGRWPPLGYSILSIWLILLFYLLGNTASEYFCSSLESLSRVLKLSPAIAGVTLLSLGNGAPDGFASLVSFTGTGARRVGLNSVVGGALFVSCVVVGIISTFMGPHQSLIDKSDFVRDICFLLLGVVSLISIMIIGAINIWGAVAFVSLYFIYVLVVYFMHFHRSRNTEDFGIDSGGELSEPILGNCEKDDLEGYCHKKEEEAGCRASFGRLLYNIVVGLPLYLPRRLTIPVVSEERWSKPFAVASVTLAPVLLGALWNSEKGSSIGSREGLVVYVIGGLIGITFGILAFLTTEKESPPKKYILPWLVAGFLMSVTWSYMIAQELIGLLISLGYVIGVSPSILGLTVLAWGNSLGDLITNCTMVAVNGGSDGVQVAMSGCYAGPTFNILVGLGMSLVVSCWLAYPSSVLIPKDPLLLETLALLVAGLVWALVILPKRNMKIDGFLGAGLLAIYLVSISLRVIQALGVGSI
ncbi:cation/calcium exchanger 1-like [Macadamia integrifolia]|uniref:cation/calcium exchanger 1-like n=1 Tax=Macadamia integrifolia TaxID=60698 RepID=UPI001C500812|nr:cation/calcium exchanger 1-like [Macadamia integrifolia]